ncbi:MAG: hypothetical protein DLM69_09870 [Candidatus Chloroheliales bacterium]|nr:MAG: hypothetical protein DLM69_09870 [Chloroflexota bacterium]
MAVANPNQISTCPRCANPVRPDARFCPFCGLRLQDVTGSLLLAGATLAGGRYYIQRLLGQGGMGAVYLAEDRHLSRPCVVKEMQTYADSPQDVTRATADFRREALILAHLSADQPAIPQTYDHFSEGPRHYLVMQYIAGENLEQRLRRLGPLPEREVLQDALAICDILAFIHNQKPEPVVHRDIKPANIIVDTQARIKLVDFGLAKAMNSDTGGLAMGMVADGLSNAAGTAGYTPIEQWMGHAQPASDIYALGATMHHLLSGRDPRDAFNGYPELNLEVIRRLTSFPPLRRLRIDITPATEQLVERMLALDPAARPSAEQVRATITDILAAPPPPTPAQLMSMSDRQLRSPAPNLPSAANPPASPLLSRAVPITPPSTSNNNAAPQSGTYSGPRLDRFSNNARRVDSLGERPNPQGNALTANHAFRFSSNDEIRSALALYLRGLIQFLPLNEPLDVYPQSLTLLPLYLIAYSLDTAIPQANRWLHKQGALIIDGTTGAALDAPLANLWLPEWVGINMLSTPGQGSVNTPPFDTIQQLDLSRLPAGYGPLPPSKPYTYDEYELQQRARRELAAANQQLVEYAGPNMSQMAGPRPEDFAFSVAVPIYGALWNANVLLRGHRYSFSVYEGSRMGQYRGRPNFLMRETNMPGRGFCTVCGKLFPPEQLVQCRTCGKAVCANDVITSGLINKKNYCSVECQERGK